MRLIRDAGFRRAGSRFRAAVGQRLGRQTARKPPAAANRNGQGRSAATAGLQPPHPRLLRSDHEQRGEWQGEARPAPPDSATRSRGLPWPSSTPPTTPGRSGRGPRRCSRRIATSRIAEGATDHDRRRVHDAGTDRNDLDVAQSQTIQRRARRPQLIGGRRTLHRHQRPTGTQEGRTPGRQPVERGHRPRGHHVHRLPADLGLVGQRSREPLGPALRAPSPARYQVLGAGSHHPLTLASPRSATTSDRNVDLRNSGSTSTTLTSVRASANGIPGNPAPLPTSATTDPSTNRSPSTAQFKRCRVQIRLASRGPTRPRSTPGPVSSCA